MREVRLMHKVVAAMHTRGEGGGPNRKRTFMFKFFFSCLKNVNFYFISLNIIVYQVLLIHYKLMYTVSTFLIMRKLMVKAFQS